MPNSMSYQHLQKPTADFLFVRYWAVDRHFATQAPAAQQLNDRRRQIVSASKIQGVGKTPKTPRRERTGSDIPRVQYELRRNRKRRPEPLLTAIYRVSVNRRETT
jgi:hypothetical protein